MFVRSTKLSLTVDWTMPKLLNGCPASSFEVLIDDGAGSDITNSVGIFDPHISQTTITSFSANDISKTFRLRVKATNAAGSVMSGVSMFILASVPAKPLPPINVIEKTNANQITVSFGTVLPDDGGAKIVNI